MKKLTSVPDTVKATIQSEHEKALSMLFESERPFCSLPTRVARMNTLRESTGEAIRDVIIPPTTICVNPGGFIDPVTLNRDALTFYVRNGAFPLGHIYKGSGHICLGNIFVPSRVSVYTPAQPLETLFLHNDRNFNHGGATLSISDTVTTKVLQILNDNYITLSNDALAISDLSNILENDTLWIMSADVLEQTSMVTAVAIMDEIYTHIFAPKHQRKDT